MPLTLTDLALHAATRPGEAGIDAPVLAGLTVAAVLYARGAMHPCGLRRAAVRRAGFFGVGLLLVAVAVVGPLDRLADRLLAGHMLQHMILLLAAPPLLIAGGALPIWIRGLPRTARRPPARLARIVMGAGAGGAVAVGVIHGAAVVAWHLPAADHAVRHHVVVHYAEHLSLLAAGAALWSAALVGARRGAAACLGAAAGMVAAAAIGGVLGLVLTLSSTTWYDGYPGAVGIGPVADQQVAGALMLAAGSLVYGATAALLLGRAVRGSGAPHAGRPAASLSPPEA